MEPDFPLQQPGLSSYLMGGGQMPPDYQQQGVIDMVKAILTDPNADPGQRAIAQQYMDKFGRNMGMVALNQATGNPFRGSGQQGRSDWLMTREPGAERGQYLSQYSPEEMEFSKNLTKAVRPGEYHGAEMAGKAASIAG